MYSLILPRWEKRCQIIVVAVASPAVVEAVLAVGPVLVWAEVDIGTAAHLHKGQAPAAVEVVDTPAGTVVGIAVVVVDLPAAQP